MYKSRPHDPLSLAFAPSFLRGQRFAQAAAVLGSQGASGPARTVPVRFHPGPPPQTPDRRADGENWRAYHQARRSKDLSTKGAPVIQDLRSLDRAGDEGRTVLGVADGGYGNRTV